MFQPILSPSPKSVAQKPVAQKPVVQKPVAQKPVAQKPVAPKPVAPKPVAQRLWGAGAIALATSLSTLGLGTSAQAQLQSSATTATQTPSRSQTELAYLFQENCVMSGRAGSSYSRVSIDRQIYPESFFLNDGAAVTCRLGSVARPHAYHSLKLVLGARDRHPDFKPLLLQVYLDGELSETRQLFVGDLQTIVINLKGANNVSIEAVDNDDPYAQRVSVIHATLEPLALMGRSGAGRSASGWSASGWSASGWSASGRSAVGRSGAGRI